MTNKVVLCVDQCEAEKVCMDLSLKLVQESVHVVKMSPTHIVSGNRNIFFVSILSGQPDSGWDIQELDFSDRARSIFECFMAWTSQLAVGGDRIESR